MMNTERRRCECGCFSQNHIGRARTAAGWMGGCMTPGCGCDEYRPAQAITPPCPNCGDTLTALVPHANGKYHIDCSHCGLRSPDCHSPESAVRTWRGMKV